VFTLQQLLHIIRQQWLMHGIARDGACQDRCSDLLATGDVVLRRRIREQT
jgi:hypothetical protein